MPTLPNLFAVRPDNRNNAALVVDTIGSLNPPTTSLITVD